MLFGQRFVEIISLPRIGFLRGVFLDNHLESTENLTRTTKKHKRILTNNKKWP